MSKKKKDEIKEELEEVQETESVETTPTPTPTPEEIIEELESQIKDLKNELLKQRADVENTRKRLEKERIIERKYAAVPIAKEILMPLDNFDLALKHAQEDESVKQFVQGFEMIKKQFIKALENEGVSEIDALDADYDPNFHQAIMTEKKDGVEPNKVTEVLQKGYMFKDRVIRPAMVKISE
jgi:molecular chaperone GrpE